MSGECESVQYVLIPVSFELTGGVHACVHTASRYDDCQLAHLPLTHVTIGYEWVCRSQPQCHHEVIRCVPDKLPLLQEGQVRATSSV